MEALSLRLDAPNIVPAFLGPSLSLFDRFFAAAQFDLLDGTA
jgi:hypothetical protein